MIKQTKKGLLAFAVFAAAAFTLTAYAAQPQAKMQKTINTPVLKTPAAVKPVSSVTASGYNGITLEGDITLNKGKQLISVSLRDSDVKQVLRMMADKAALNIVFHDSVKGNVTLDLVNVPLNDAFKMIMQATELSYFIQNNTIIVSAAEATKKLNISKQAMSSIPIKYADATKIANFLNKNVFAINKPGLSNSEIVVTNPEKNELLIFGTVSDFNMAKKVVERLDLKPTLTTYKVNHTTPKEMASSICQTLFLTNSQGLSGTNGSTGSVNNIGPSDGSNTMAPPMPGMTGGAAGVGTSSTGSSSSSSGIGSTSSSSTGTTGGNSTSFMQLGGAKVACQVSTSLQTGSGGNNLSSFSGHTMTIAYYPQLGTITVNGGSVEQTRLIDEFIKTHDKKQPQAYVEISVIELSEDGSKEFQNNWTLLTDTVSLAFDSVNGLMTPTNLPIFWKGNGYTPNVVPGGPTYSKWTGSAQLSQSIKYLITNKKGRMLSNPKIIITNGQRSVIDLSSDYVKTVRSEILVTSTGTTAGGTQKTVEIGNDNGMKIEMIPFISPDGYVTLNLKPQFSTEKDKYYYKGPSGETDLGATLLQRRTLELNNVRIKDGDTLVIGGIIIEDEKKEVTKIPVLGDIPYLGVVFRNTKNVNLKNELVILVTPRIIADEDDTLVNKPTRNTL